MLANSLHFSLGAAVQVFQFRRKTTKSIFEFVFVGVGLGVGKGAGASTPFVTPHELLVDMGRLHYEVFRDAGLALAGKPERGVKDPGWADAIGVWTALECDSAFSAVDLHRAFGRLTCASASIAIGYSATVITAFRLDRTFFYSQEIVGGQAGGVSLTASTNVGMWFQI